MIGRAVRWGIVAMALPPVTIVWAASAVGEAAVVARRHAQRAESDRPHGGRYRDKLAYRMRRKRLRRRAADARLLADKISRHWESIRV